MWKEMIFFLYIDVSTTTQCTIYCSVELPSEKYSHSKPTKYPIQRHVSECTHIKNQQQVDDSLAMAYFSNTHAFFIPSVWFCFSVYLGHKRKCFNDIILYTINEAIYLCRNAPLFLSQNFVALTPLDEWIQSWKMFVHSLYAKDLLKVLAVKNWFSLSKGDGKRNTLEN